VILEPLELLERLAALVPAPMRHQLRYHRTLAPNAAWRSLIVPRVRDEREESRCSATKAAGESSRGPRIAWADLIKRVFLADVLACPRCGGRMRVIATITTPEAIRKILTCVGLPARPPPLAPAREREQAEFGFEG